MQFSQDLKTPPPSPERGILLKFRFYEKCCLEQFFTCIFSEIRKEKAKKKSKKKTSHENYDTWNSLGNANSDPWNPFGDWVPRGKIFLVFLETENPFLKKIANLKAKLKIK